MVSAVTVAERTVAAVSMVAISFTAEEAGDSRIHVAYFHCKADAKHNMRQDKDSDAAENNSAATTMRGKSTTTITKVKSASKQVPRRTRRPHQVGSATGDDGERHETNKNERTNASTNKRTHDDDDVCVSTYLINGINTCGRTKYQCKISLHNYLYSNNNNHCRCIIINQSAAKKESAVRVT